MKNREFARLDKNERFERMVRIVRSRAFDSLLTEELNEIMKHVDVMKQYSIRVITSPVEYERFLTLKCRKEDINGHERSTDTEGQYIFGGYEFGKSIIKLNSKGVSGKTHKAVLKDVFHPAAALISVHNRGFDDLSILMDEDIIAVYVPEEMLKMAG